MGKKNDAIVPFFKDKSRFSDLFNGALFNGEQLIKPEELELVDSVSTTVLRDKKRKKHNVSRYRDIAMTWKNEIKFILLACEIQENVHYAMPVRNMFYDSLSYTEQIDDVWKKLSEKEKSEVSSGEFLSHFRKDDFIYPIITVVFYYGDDWDGSIDLHSMFKIENTTGMSILNKYVPNYHINLINPTKIKDLSIFKSDLQLIFGMLKYKDDKDKLFNFTKDNSSFFRSVSTKTALAISAFLNYDRLLDKILEKDEKEDKDMCKALEDLYNDGVAEGEVRGKILGSIEAYRSMEFKDETIVDKLIEIYDISRDKAKEFVF